MTRRHCFCNYAASDVDLSLALIAGPDAHLLLAEWGDAGPPSSCGQVVSRSPSEAQTGATGEIGIVLMAPRAPTTQQQNHKRRRNVTLNEGQITPADSRPAVLEPVCYHTRVVHLMSLRAEDQAKINIIFSERRGSVGRNVSNFRC